MPSGGARVTSGPPPDPRSLRSQRLGFSDGWRELPEAGRKGRLPRWPLEDQTDREKALWREMWKLPQAVMWEEMRQQWSVGLVVRLRARAEGRSSSAALLMELRQHEDSLGLTTPGMLRNRWRLSVPQVAAAEVPKATAAAPESARSRLALIADGQRRA